MSDKTGKQPYFPFYPTAWLADGKVRCLSPAERGAYIDLLCYEWNETGLPTDEKSLRTLSGLGKQWSRSREKLLALFVPKGTKLVNPRSERERAKRAAFIEKCRLAGKKSANGRKDLK